VLDTLISCNVCSLLGYIVRYDQWMEFADTFYSESLTFNDWNTFVEAFPKEINLHHQFNVQKEAERSFEPTQLSSIVGRMAKLDTSLVTFLCIGGYDLTFDHLMTLINIPMLGGLVLGRLNSEVNPRHIGLWTRTACERGTLQKLKLLVINARNMGRAQILPGLLGLPSLCLAGLLTGLQRPEPSWGGWKVMSSLWCVQFPKHTLTICALSGSRKTQS
jgi:hypothetical protein